jgi:hypothetical protein
MSLEGLFLLTEAVVGKQIYKNQNVFCRRLILSFCDSKKGMHFLSFILSGAANIVHFLLSALSLPS